MTNIDKVSMALSEWVFNIAASVLPQYRIPQGSALGNMMQGFFGVDPATYNIWKELGFIAEPVIETLITPGITRMLSGLPEDRIPEMAGKFVDSFIEQAREKGEVNLFGLALKEDAFQGLKAILTKTMEAEI